MTTRFCRVVVGATAALGALLASHAFALNNRSGVASYGNDANACTIVAPCFTLQGAIDKTNAGGEVIVLDSHSIGGAVVNKSISIVAAANVDARVLVGPSMIGIDVDAGANDDVSIDGINFQGDVTATNAPVTSSTGVRLRGGRSTHVKRCKAHRVSKFVFIDPTVAATRKHVRISHCVAQDVDTGVHATGLDNLADGLHLHINRFRLNGASNRGLHVHGRARIVVNDSTFVGVANITGDAVAVEGVADAPFSDMVVVLNRGMLHRNNRGLNIVEANGGTARFFGSRSDAYQNDDDCAGVGMVVVTDRSNTAVSQTPPSCVYNSGAEY